MNHWWGIEKTYVIVKSRVRTLFYDKPRRDLFTVLVAIGIEMAWIIYGRLCGTYEAVVLMLREKLKWKPHKSLSTDEEHSGGLAHSSDEALVMRVEQRG